MARDCSSHQGQIDAQLRKLNDHGSHRRAPTVDENLSLVATWLGRRWNTKFLILQSDFISITATLVVMNGTYEATPRCQDCDTCCRCFFEAQVVRDVQRDVRLDHTILVSGKRQEKGSGRLTKAGDFDQGGAGEGPEGILKMREEQNPGSDEFGRSRRELQDQV